MSVLPDPETTILPALPEGWYVQSYSVLSGGLLAVVGADTNVNAAFEKDVVQKTFGTPLRLAANATGRVWLLQDGQLIEQLQFPLLYPFPKLDRFPNGRWLVVNARSKGDRNARVFASNGDEERRIELGDGVGHIKIDRQQRIWVGWFDEGVFGNDNWKLPGREWAPSVHGIAAFNDQGEVVAHATLASIADCYCLNVFDDEAWACTYTDFPIWQMRDHVERTWPTTLSGAQAIAVKSPYVLAAGGYQSHANRVQLLRLEEQKVRFLGEWRLPFGADNPVRLIDGRGDELHVVQGQYWHRWNIADFVRAID